MKWSLLKVLNPVSAITYVLEGEIGDNFYVVEKGTLDVFVNKNDGKGETKCIAHLNISKKE